MTQRDDLVAEEGVDEGSAASAVEGADSSGGDVLGEPPHGAPQTEQDAAGPVDMESEQSRSAREAAGPGQQLGQGEG